MDFPKFVQPDVRRIQALLCEFIGTMMLVLTISLAAVQKSTMNDPNNASFPPTYIAVGFALGAMIYAFDHISGAHFNPAVTLGALLNKRITIIMAILFILMQTLGGVAGGLLAYAIRGPDNAQLVQDTLVPSSVGPAFTVEFLYSLAIVLVMQNAALEKNTREPNSYFGLAVAFTALAGSKAVAPISGGCFNPAVGTGLNFASLVEPGGGSMSQVWIYWVAPLLGGVVASGIKAYMNLPSHQEADGLPLVVPLTEALGTFFLTLTASLTSDGLAVGAILLAMIYMGDHVCGADYNPAVTLGVAIRMSVPWREYWKVGVTMLAQFAGAMGGAFVALGVAGTVQYPSPGGAGGLAGAVVFEAIWTSLLVYVVCAVMTPTHGDDDPAVTEERKGHSRSYQGLAIGFTVAAGIYCASKTGGASGGIFNPALGTALVSADVANQGNSDPAKPLWVYWVGPFAGSLLGAGTFSLLHYHRDPMMVDYEVFEPSFY